MGDILGELPFHANGKQRKRRIRMKETIILLYFLQTDYGRRLLRFLTRKKNKQIRLELMTERERVMWRTETENQRIVVLTDDEGLYAEAKKR